MFREMAVYCTTVNEDKTYNRTFVYNLGYNRAPF